MQLPTIAPSDSDSDDEVELYQVPESVQLQAADQAEASGKQLHPQPGLQPHVAYYSVGPTGVQAEGTTPSAGKPASEQQAARTPGTQPAVPSCSSCSQPAQHPVGWSNGQHTSSSTHTSGEALATSLLQALGFPEPEAAPEAPDLAPESVPLSSTSSASHVPAAAADRRACISRSSSDDSSSASDMDLYSSFSTSTATGSSTAGIPPAADSNSITVLEVDGLLPDSDLDALLKRLTEARDAAGAGASTATVSMPAQHTGRSMGRQSSSDLSSDNSSSSLVNDPQGLDSSSPPPSSTYSSYEPRWLKQQRQQQQHCAGSKSSSIAGSIGPPMRKLPCAERLWVPEPPSTVLDLRSSAATVQGASAAAAAAAAEGGAAPCADTNVLKLQAGGSVKSASKAAGSGMWVGDSGSESDSSEEDWQQFRQRQRGATGMVAPAVAQKQPV